MQTNHPWNKTKSGLPNIVKGEQHYTLKQPWCITYHETHPLEKRTIFFFSKSGLCTDCLSQLSAVSRWKADCIYVSGYDECIFSYDIYRTFEVCQRSLSSNVAVESIAISITKPCWEPLALVTIILTGFPRQRLWWMYFFLRHLYDFRSLQEKSFEQCDGWEYCYKHHKSLLRTVSFSRIILTGLPPALVRLSLSPCLETLFTCSSTFPQPWGEVRYVARPIGWVPGGNGNVASAILHQSSSSAHSKNMNVI